MAAPQSIQTASLPDATAHGPIHIRIQNLERALAFYRDLLGFHVIDRNANQAALGPVGAVTPVVSLREIPGIGPAPRRAAGMYHFAILLPSRPDLARFARHLVENRIPFGQSDHAVSEAFYFDDPDGNGIEVYADRPRDTWEFTDGIVQMTGDPIDFEDLLGEIPDDGASWSGMPSGTTIGHVHLKVSDLNRSKAFYVDRLGLDISADYVRGALFASAGGYHHHIGMNVWQSRGSSLVRDDVAGLDSFTLVLPDRAGWEAAVRRLGGTPPDGGVYRANDPDGIAIELVCNG